MRVAIELDLEDILIARTWNEFQKSIGKSSMESSTREFIRAALIKVWKKKVEKLRHELEREELWRNHGPGLSIPEWHIKKLKER